MACQTKPGVKQINGGTHPYRAPEVILHQRHEASVDYYALGVIAYYCMLQKHFPVPSKDDLARKLKKGELKQIKIHRDDVPEGWSSRSADFINKCIKINPEKRLGFSYTTGNGQIDELINHKWFKGFDWDKLRAQTLVSPFIPEQRSTNYYRGNAIKDFKDEGTAKLLMYQDRLKESKVQRAFDGFDYDLRR